VRCPCSSLRLHNAQSGPLHQSVPWAWTWLVMVIACEEHAEWRTRATRDECAAPPLLHSRRRVRPPRRGGPRRGRDGDVVGIQVRHRARVDVRPVQPAQSSGVLGTAS